MLKTEKMKFRLSYRNCEWEDAVSFSWYK